MAEQQVKKNFNGNKRNNNKNHKKVNNTNINNPNKVPENMGSHRGYMVYQMSAESAEAILNSRNKNEAKIDPQKYLCDMINESNDFINYCIKVNYR